MLPDTDESRGSNSSKPLSISWFVEKYTSSGGWSKLWFVLAGNLSTVAKGEDTWSVLSDREFDLGAESEETFGAAVTRSSPFLQIKLVLSRLVHAGSMKDIII